MAGTTGWEWGNIDRREDLSTVGGVGIKRDNWSLTRNRTSDEVFASQLGETAGILSGFNGGVTETVTAPQLRNAISFDSSTEWVNGDDVWVKTGKIINRRPVYVLSVGGTNLPVGSLANVIFAASTSVGGTSFYWTLAEYTPDEVISGSFAHEIGDTSFSLNYIRSSTSKTTSDNEQLTPAGVAFLTTSTNWSGYSSSISWLVQTTGLLTCPGDDQTYNQQGVDWYKQTQTWAFTGSWYSGAADANPSDLIDNFDHILMNVEFDSSGDISRVGKNAALAVLTKTAGGYSMPVANYAAFGTLDAVRCRDYWFSDATTPIERTASELRVASWVDDCIDGRYSGLLLRGVVCMEDKVLWEKTPTTVTLDGSILGQADFSMPSNDRYADPIGISVSVGMGIKKTSSETTGCHFFDCFEGVNDGSRAYYDGSDGYIYLVMNGTTIKCDSYDSTNPNIAKEVLHDGQAHGLYFYMGLYSTIVHLDNVKILNSGFEYQVDSIQNITFFSKQDFSDKFIGDVSSVSVTDRGAFQINEGSGDTSQNEDESLSITWTDGTTPTAPIWSGNVDKDGINSMLLGGNRNNTTTEQWLCANTTATIDSAGTTLTSAQLEQRSKWQLANSMGGSI